jgi:hypothetical protein
VTAQTRRECRNCGAVVSRDARFCKRCGAPLSTAAALDGDERVPVPPPRPRNPPSPAFYWGTRVALGVLIGLTAIALLFAIAVLVFGAFVE